MTDKTKAPAGLLVSVLRNASYGSCDCTNGGVTSTHDRAILVGPGIPEVFAATAGEPVLKLVKRNLCGRPYYHAEPVDAPPAGNLGWMNGGNFVFSSDSRFPLDYPVSVHDRSETPELYAALST